MSQERDYKLCGGTFFTLLLHAKKDNLQKATDAFMGNSNRLSDVDLLWALISIVRNDDVNILSNKERRRKIQKDCSHYKLCERNSIGPVSLTDNHVRKYFDQEIKTNYQMSLTKMVQFVTTYIDGNKEKDLVKALIETLKLDSTINSNQLFFCQYDGRPMTKAEICEANELCIEAFLLGILHYIVECVPDNMIGKETIEKWCPRADKEKGSKRIYSAAIGENSSLDIDVTHFESAKEKPIDKHLENNSKGNNTAYDEQKPLIAFTISNLSETDAKQLERFKSDYDDLVIQCIRTDFTLPNLHFDLFDRIDYMNAVWEAKVQKIKSEELKGFLIDIMQLLQVFTELSLDISEQILKVYDYNNNGDPLSLIQSEEEYRTIKNVIGPKTRNLRFSLQKRFRAIHPKQYPTLQLSDAISDHDLLELFKSEAECIILDCIKTDFTAGPIDCSLSDRINCLIDMWNSKLKYIKDERTKKTINSTIEILSSCLNYLSYKYMRIIETPHGWSMVPRNESKEEGEALNNELRPKTSELRHSLSLLYTRLYVGQEPH